MNRQSLKEKPVQLKVDSGKWKVQVQIRHANLIGRGLWLHINRLSHRRKRTATINYPLSTINDPLNRLSF